MKALVFLAAALLAGCASRPDHLQPEDALADGPWALTAHTGAGLVFPDALAGRPALVTVVYTHCPDVCLVTMANATRIRARLGPDTSRVAFLTLTFDPARDSVAVLRDYARTWRTGPDWTLATGDTATVGRLMRRLGVRVRAEAPDSTGAYAITHSDRMLLLDADGRIVETYGANAVAPEMVAGDVRALLP